MLTEPAFSANFDGRPIPVRPNRKDVVKTFVLFGITTKYPQLQCVVAAESLAEAASKLGGTLSDTPVDSTYTEATLFKRGTEAATFVPGNMTGVELAKAAGMAPPLPPGAPPEAMHVFTDMLKDIFPLFILGSTDSI